MNGLRICRDICILLSAGIIWMPGIEAFGERIRTSDEIRLTSALQPPEEMPDWECIKRDVAAATAKKGIFELAKDSSHSSATDGKQALFRLRAFMEAGCNQEAIQELEALKKHLTSYPVCPIYNDACDRQHAAWDVAKAILDAFPNSMDGTYLDNLTEHLINSGWSFQGVDQWMAEKPAGVQNFWIKNRLRFQAKYQSSEILEKQLADTVKAHPSDIKGAIEFLEALLYEGKQYTGKPWTDLGWLSDIIRPEQATDAMRLARLCEGLSETKNAEAYYRMAASIPLSRDEIFRDMWQRPVSDAFRRAHFEANAKESLAKCLQRQGKTEEAQKCLNEAADIRLKNPWESVMQVARATEVQKTDETLREDNPVLWKNRASFFIARGELEKAEEAFKKGLELAPPEIPPEKGWRGKHGVDIRFSLLGDYTRFLRDQGRTWDHFFLLRNEIEKMPMAAESTMNAAKGLVGFKDMIWADDPVLWGWLERRPEWTNLEEQLLYCMALRAKTREEVLDVAERLALGKDPSRSIVLGRVEIRLQLIKRAIPLLREVRERSQDDNLKETAAEASLKACLKSGDRQLIQTVFPEGLKLTPERLYVCLEDSDWWAVQFLFPDILNQPSFWNHKLAAVAAKGGAKADALRIWDYCAKAEPAKLDLLPGLVRSGLRDELIAFYTNLQKEMPSSAIPAKALSLLKALPRN